MPDPRVADAMSIVVSYKVRGVGFEPHDLQIVSPPTPQVSVDVIGSQFRKAVRFKVATFPLLYLPNKWSEIPDALPLRYPRMCFTLYDMLHALSRARSQVHQNEQATAVIPLGPLPLKLAVRPAQMAGPTSGPVHRLVGR